MDKIIDRIQKLLNLAEGTENEEEASLAACRAAELMTQYEISRAEVDSHGLDIDDSNEEILKDYKIGTPWSKRTGWKDILLYAIADSQNCKLYYTTVRQGNPRKFMRRLQQNVLFGRESRCQAVDYIYKFLEKEITRLADNAREQYIKEHSYRRPGKAWCNAFCVGAAAAISNRLALQKRNEVRNLRDGKVVMNGETKNVSQKALIRIDESREKVHNEYSKFSKGFRTIGSVGQTTNMSGYSAGREAGSNINLESKGGLNAPPKKIR